MISYQMAVRDSACVCKTCRRNATHLLAALSACVCVKTCRRNATHFVPAVLRGQDFSISRFSHALAYVQSASAVDCEMPSMSATSGKVKPAK